MPSPFPGMDPYLEHPDIFPGLHDGLIAYLRESLQPLLPPPYHADIGRRTWVHAPHDETCRRDGFLLAISVDHLPPRFQLS